MFTNLHRRCIQTIIMLRQIQLIAFICFIAGIGPDCIIGADRTPGPMLLTKAQTTPTLLSSSDKPVAETHQNEPGERLEEGRKSLNIGLEYYFKEQYQEALEKLSKAWEIFRDLGNREDEALALMRIGDTYAELNQFTEAFKSYHDAWEIVDEENINIGKIAILTSIGAAYTDLGYYMKAIQHYRQALTVLDEMDMDEDTKNPYKGTILMSIAITYARFGYYEQVLLHSQKALEIFQNTDIKNEAATLTTLGMAYEDQGQLNSGYYLKALGYYKDALDIYLLLEEQSESHNAGMFSNIGRTYDYWGWSVKRPELLKQALTFYEKSLEITTGKEALKSIQGKTLTNMAEAYIHLSFYENTTEHLNHALKLLAEALEIQQAIGDRAKEWTTLSNIGWVYELQGNDEQALSFYRQAIEGLEDVTGSAGIAEFKISLNNQAAATYQMTILLLLRMGQLEQAFEFSERARARVFLDQLGNIRLENHTQTGETLIQKKNGLSRELAELEQRLKVQNAQSEFKRLSEKLKTKRQEYEDVLVNIKVNEYASLTSVAPPGLKDIQERLNQETTLLSYFVTPDKTLAFVITRNAFKTVELPVSKRELEKAISEFRHLAIVNDPSPKVLETLYQWLIAPIKDHLSTPLIGIIPHDILHYLPFAALSDGQQYLNDTYTLFSLPGASVLKFMQKKQESEGETIMAIANSKAEGWSILYHADQEVQAISKLYKADALIGEDASETAFKKRAGDFSIVHVAAHGELNSTSPLFSRLVLSSDKENDGVLEVHEVYEMDLTQTDLVVLSACETKLGKRSRGDDIIGLNRAFIYAGASSVIATLWKVNDRATKDFMIAFYKQLKHGKSKAEALRTAQRKIRATYPHPYYWAGFVLTGDPGITTAQVPWLNIMIIVLIVGGILAMVSRKAF